MEKQSSYNFQFYPNNSDDLYMEDVREISLEIYDLIEKKLREFGIEIQEDQEDELYTPIRDVIERYSNGEYSHEL